MDYMAFVLWVAAVAAVSFLVGAQLGKNVERRTLMCEARKYSAENPEAGAAYQCGVSDGINMTLDMTPDGAAEIETTLRSFLI